MTYDLSESERTMLLLILEHCKTRNQEVELDELVKEYKFKSPFHRAPIKKDTRSRRGNAKQRLRMLILKLAASGILLERVSGLGSGHKARYAFRSEASIVKAKKLCVAEDEMDAA